MYISPLSPVLKKALEAASSDTVNYLHTSDSSALKQFFCEKVSSVLLKRQKMIVVIPDGMSSSIPAKLLSPLQLAHYTMHYDRSQPMTEGQIDRLQQLHKLAEIPVEAGRFKKHVQQEDLLHKQIDVILGKISKDDESGPSLKDLVMTNTEDPKVHLSKDTRRQMKSIAIDDRTLSSIDRLQSSHKPYFDFIKSSSFLTDAALSDGHSRKMALEEIGSLYKGVSDVVQGMEVELEAVYTQLERTIREECKVWRDIRKELELAIFNNDLADGATSFEDAYRQVMTPTKKLFYLRLALDRKPELNWGEAQLVLQGIDGLLSGVDQAITTHFKSLLKRMTPFNINKPELKDIIEKAMSIIRAINKSQYLDTQLPITYLQIGELKKQVNNVKAQLTLALNALHDSSYCEFMMLLHQVGMPRKVSEALLDANPTSWRAIINHTVRQHLIDERYDDSISQLPGLYDRVHREQNAKGDIVKTEIHNIWLRIREKAITDIKNAHWDIYKALWGEGKCEFSTASLISQMPAAFTSFCPITITHESDFLNLLEQQASVFDEVFFLDNRELTDKMITTAHSYIKAVTIATSYDINPSSTLDDNLTVKSYFSSDLKFPEVEISSTELGTERYRAVLPVATALADVMSSVTIYKVAEKLILSFVDGQINQLFEKTAKLQTKHILYRNTNEVAPLVETLMLDKDIHIIVENNLINDTSAEHVIWQQQLIKNMAPLGIAVHNLSFADVYRNRDAAVLDLCESLRLVALSSEEGVAKQLELV